MKKLRLQMQVSVDGYVAGPEGQLDWMTFDTDPALLEFVNQLTDASDSILMGRKMSPEFLNYWENIVDNQKDSPEFTFAQKMVKIPKIVFSKTLNDIKGKNARVEKGDLKEEVNKLKKQAGKDLIVYGGAGFVRSLIQENLIDDYYLAINPIAIGKGMSIFFDRTPLKLIKSTGYGDGVVVNHYQRV
jgi:dihydrofolate reductase